MELVWDGCKQSKRGKEQWTCCSYAHMKNPWFKLELWYEDDLSNIICMKMISINIIRMKMISINIICMKMISINIICMKFSGNISCKFFSYKFFNEIIFLPVLPSIAPVELGWMSIKTRQENVRKDVIIWMVAYI